VKSTPEPEKHKVLIRTPDQRLRVFVSSTLKELEAERKAVHQAITRLRLAPVMFESGARPHPAQELYQAYLSQSHRLSAKGTSRLSVDGELAQSSFLWYK